MKSLFLGFTSNHYTRKNLHLWKADSRELSGMPERLDSTFRGLRPPILKYRPLRVEVVKTDGNHKKDK